MDLNIGKVATALKGMTAPELRARYAEVFGEATKTRHKDYLLRRIAWRLQANAEGGLSERARQRAMDLAKDSDVRITGPRKEPAGTGNPAVVAAIQFSQDGRLPMPGTILAREYKGQVFEVKVLPKGFEYQGEIFRSLSAVAKVITGMHWNGYHFFGLVKKGGNGDGREED
jgi:hypothetical protein